jgi:cell division initiation protein
MIHKKDILDRKFNKSLRGYDPVEVNYFLEMLADEFEKMEQRIQELGPLEKQFSDADAKSPKEIIAEAEETAKKIMTDAEKVSAEVLNTAKKQKELEKKEIIQLKNKKSKLIKTLKETIAQQRQLINYLSNLEEDQEDLVVDDQP